MTPTSTALADIKTHQAIEPVNGNDAITLRVERLKAVSPYYPPSQEKPYNPDVIARKRPQFGVYDEMRRDDQVKAVLWLKKFMILSSGWEIKTEGDQYLDIAKEISGNLSNIESPDFGDAICNMLTHLDFGFSITEPTFEVNGQDQIELRTLKTRPPHSFEFETDDYGNIIRLRQYTSSGFQYTDMQGLCHLVHQYEFGIPYGISDLQSAYTAWFSKQIIIKYWNIFLERFGNPHIVITVPGSISEADKNTLDEIIKNLQAKSGMQVPEGTQVDIKGSPTGATDFEKAVDKYNGMIARSMLVPDLIGIAGPTIAGGSYALGEKHFEIFYITIEKIRTDLERCVNKSIVWPLAFLNYGISDRSAIFWQINRPSTDDKFKMLDLWVRATQSKIWEASDEEVNYFRRQIRFPTGSVDRPQPTQGNTPFKPGFSKTKTFIRRPKTEYEKKVDFAKISSIHDGLEQDAANALVPVYRKIKEGLIDTVKNKRLVDGKKLDEVTDLKLKFLKDLQMTWRSILKSTFDAGKKSAQAEIKEAKKTAKMQEDIDLTQVFEDVLDERSFYITGLQRDQILIDARQILLNVIETGASTKEAIKQLEQLFEGQYEFDRQRLETIVRTNISKSFNWGRRRLFEDQSLDGFVNGYQYSAIIDSRTTAICEQLDGHAWLASDPYIDLITPPNHYNCRALLIPIVEGEDFTPSGEVVRRDALEAFKGEL